MSFAKRLDRPMTPLLRVLVIDDEHDTTDTMATLVRCWGHKVDVAFDGLQAFDRAMRFLPDVMLVDLSMPRLDGFAFARLVRQEDALAGSVLIAVSGYGREEDRQRSLEAGFDHHMTKPVEPEELWRLLSPE